MSYATRFVERNVVFLAYWGQDVLEVIVLFVIWGVFWGLVTRTVNRNRGYEGGFWLGFWLGFIGLIIVACKPVNYEQLENWVNTTTGSFENMETDDLKPEEGKWRCYRCGSINTSDTGICYCGAIRLTDKGEEGGRQEKREPKPKHIQPLMKTSNQSSARSETSDIEIENIKKLKMYKELLDLEVITQEEFENKKKELLR